MASGTVAAARPAHEATYRAAGLLPAEPREAFDPRSVGPVGPQRTYFRHPYDDDVWEDCLWRQEPKEPMEGEEQLHSADGFWDDEQQRFISMDSYYKYAPRPPGVEEKQQRAAASQGRTQQRMQYDFDDAADNPEFTSHTTVRDVPRILPPPPSPEREPSPPPPPPPPPQPVRNLAYVAPGKGVCSQSDDAATWVKPFPLNGLNGEQAIDLIIGIVQKAEPGRAHVVDRAPGYVCLEHQMGNLVIDDVEFWADPYHHVVHTRSASRDNVPSDNGANFDRVRYAFGQLAQHRPSVPPPLSKAATPSPWATVGVNAQAAPGYTWSQEQLPAGTRRF